MNTGQICLKNFILNCVYMYMLHYFPYSIGSFFNRIGKYLEYVYCCINRFTLLCKNLFNLLEFLVEIVDAMCIIFNAWRSTGTIKPWKWCTWHRKASAKNSSKLNKFLHREVNQLIQRIIAQDQDGQNNNNSFQGYQSFNSPGRCLKLLVPSLKLLYNP